jgi:hypothetical protein
MTYLALPPCGDPRVHLPPLTLTLTSNPITLITLLLTLTLTLTRYQDWLLHFGDDLVLQRGRMIYDSGKKTWLLACLQDGSASTKLSNYIKAVQPLGRSGAQQKYSAVAVGILPPAPTAAGVLHITRTSHAHSHAHYTHTHTHAPNEAAAVSTPALVAHWLDTSSSCQMR